MRSVRFMVGIVWDVGRAIARVADAVGVGLLLGAGVLLTDIADRWDRAR